MARMWCGQSAYWAVRSMRVANNLRVTRSEASGATNERRVKGFWASCGEGLKAVPSAAMKSEGMDKFGADIWVILEWKNQSFGGARQMHSATRTKGCHPGCPSIVYGMRSLPRWWLERQGRGRGGSQGDWIATNPKQYEVLSRRQLAARSECAVVGWHTRAQ